MTFEDFLHLILFHSSTFANIATVVAVIFAIRGYYQARNHWKSKYHEQLMLSYQDVRDGCYLMFRLQARLAYIDSTMRLLQEEHGENANLDTYYSDKDRFAKELIEAEKDMSRALVELFSNVQLLKNLKISHSTYLNRRYIFSAIEEIRQAVQQQPRPEQERIAIGFGNPFELGKKWHKLDDEFNVT